MRKSTDESKAYALNNDDNKDEMSFWGAITLRSGRTVKAKSKFFEVSLKPIFGIVTQTRKG